MPAARRTIARSAVLGLLLAAAVVLSGCTAVVIGRPHAAQPPVDNATPGEVTIVGASDDPTDDLARNALADLQTFWTQQFPDVFGTKFTPLRGGYFSVDPNNIDRSQYPQGIGCGSRPLDVEGNAFYCQSPNTPHSDSISYDRAFLAELANDHGRFLPELVMAHEFGHAIQARTQTPATSIATETQADCYAGAWSGWVAAGKAQHSELHESDLDQLLAGYLLLRDPVGTGAGRQQAHGSFFDRVSAFQEGFDDGAPACRDHFGRDRVFTAGTFTDEELGRANPSDASYSEVIGIVDESLPAVWEQAFRDVFKKPFSAPTLQPFDGEAPSCADDPARDLVYCSNKKLVGYDETDLTKPAHDDIGDFAVAAAISLPYNEAVRDQLGRSTEDDKAVKSTVCLTGWYTAKLFNQQGGTDAQLSPGDVDEAVSFLLQYAGKAEVIPDVGLSGFQLVDLFRNGFVRGLSACDVGV